MRFTSHWKENFTTYFPSVFRMNNTETVRICLTSIPRISDVIHFVWIQREFSSSVRKPETQETRKFKQTICVYYVSIAMDLIMVVIKSRCLCNNVCCIRTRDYFFYAQPAQQHHSFFVLSEFAISAQLISDEQFFRQRVYYVNETQLNAHAH